MPLRFAVQSPTHLVRQPVAQCLAGLGCEVREYGSIEEAVARLNEFVPDILVVDADAVPRQWRTLASGLGRGRVGLVLLAGRVSFDDAHDAQTLGVAGIIRKPFRGGEHAGRLIEAALARRGVRARRAVPRLPLDGSTDATLDIALPAGDERLPLWNLSTVGAAVAVPSPESRSALREGEYFPAAGIAWGGVRLALSLRVRHVTEDVVGLQFLSVVDGARDLARALAERFARLVGPLENRSRW